MFMIMGVIAFMSIQLVIGRVPQILHGGPYAISRRIMGWAFGAIPFTFCALFLFDSQFIDSSHRIAINISAYHLSASLMHLSFMALITQRLPLWTLHFYLFLLRIAFIPLLLLGGFLLHLEEVVLHTATILFSVNLMLQIMHFVYSCRTLMQNIDDKFTQEIAIHMRWIHRVKYMLILLACLSAITPIFYTHHQAIEFCFMCYVMVIFAFIYDGFERILTEYETIDVTKNGIEDIADVDITPPLEVQIPQTTLSQLHSERIHQEVTRWVESKKYCQTGVTIEMVSNVVHSNRTYVSNYINTYYNVSFKAWITNLRIEEAKRLLCSQTALSVAEIAQRVGFSSQSSFSQVFVKCVGTPPSRWRSENSGSIRNAECMTNLES